VARMQRLVLFSIERDLFVDVSWSSRVISAGISYERLKNDAIGYKEKRWNLVGAYDFVGVKVIVVF
jgi:hypothetical protein